MLVRRLHLELLLLFPIAAGGVACGPAATHPAAQPATAHDVPARGGPIKSDEEYGSARAAYDALAPDDAKRAGQRTRLGTYVLTQVTTALDRNQIDEAFDQFKQVITLYSPEELVQPVALAGLDAAAQRVELAFRKRGAHAEVVTALAVQISVSRERKAAAQRYEELKSWLEATPVATETRVTGVYRVIEDLEATAKLWPSPFVVDHLVELYAGKPTSLDPVRRPRRGTDVRELVTGNLPSAYYLARVYLRIGKLDKAFDAIKPLRTTSESDPQLYQLLEKLNASTATGGDTVSLALYFTRQGRDDRDVSMRICRDGMRRFPQALEPRLCVGELARSLDQAVLALSTFESVVQLEPKRREAWEALALLYQVRLVQLAGDENLNVAALQELLKRVEAFHAEAARLFAQEGPIRPTMADALREVGRGYYTVGHLDDAVKYLGRSVAIEPSVGALEQLGLIKLKQGQPREAAVLVERALNMPARDKNERIYVQARLRRLLGDALEQAQDTAEAERVRRAAVADWEVLLGLGELTAEGTAESNLEKAKLHYQLGERERAVDCFHKAIEAAPDRGSTYADAIAFLVARGELDEALDAYHRALGRNEVTDYLKVYCSLWIVDLAHRAGAPEDALAAAYLRSTDGGKWYDDLARWSTGRLPENALVDRADTPGRKAEAAFYRAMRAWSDGKKDAANQLWQEVIKTNMMGFFEYDMAGFYLRRGGAPDRPVLKAGAPLAPVSPSRKPPDGSI